MHVGEVDRAEFLADPTVDRHDVRARGDLARERVPGFLDRGGEVVLGLGPVVPGEDPPGDHGQEDEGAEGFHPPGTLRPGVQVDPHIAAGPGIVARALQQGGGPARGGGLAPGRVVPLHRGGADDLRDVGGRGGGVDDVGEDDGDVVLPARAQGEIDEAVGAFVEVGDLAEDLRDRVGGDHPGQAVGA